ncbi:MAG: hypothetical protein FWC41_05170 [Firmicutes bacterium]|nr:hypothetical protein [Bacillota bacterium]
MKIKTDSKEQELTEDQVKEVKDKLLTSNVKELNDLIEQRKETLKIITLIDKNIKNEPQNLKNKKKPPSKRQIEGIIKDFDKMINKTKKRIEEIQNII